MNRRFFLIPPLSMLILGCKKDPGVCCTIVDIDMHIAVQSHANLDLLDPQSNKFNPDNIDVFDKTESGFVRVFDSNMDQPKRFIITKNPNTGKYQLKLGLNVNTVDGVSQTLVKFGDNLPDTIRAVVTKKGGNTIVSKVTIGSSTFERTELYTFVKD